MQLTVCLLRAKIQFGPHQNLQPQNSTSSWIMTHRLPPPDHEKKGLGCSEGFMQGAFKDLKNTQLYTLPVLSQHFRHVP